MTIREFIEQTNLNHSLLLGYYGGGNYGDELLLEVLQNLLAQNRATDIAVAYQRPDQFLKMHHNVGYQPFDIRSTWQLLRHTMQSKNIIVGGGGLWGVDMNFNTLLMSICLWISRWILRRKIYLLGVGYYRSTTYAGHIGAWFAGKAANRIFARDTQTYDGFRRIAGSRVYKDKDLAWYITSLQLSSYKNEARRLGHRLGIRHKKTLFIAIRRPQARKHHDAFQVFHQHINNYLAANLGTPAVITQLELPDIDPAGHELLGEWNKKYPQTKILHGAINPLVLYSFFHIYRKQLVLVAPQFHIILTAHLNGVPFLPVSYDNKVNALFDSISVRQRIPITDITLAHIQQFSDQQLVV